ncbi:ATP-dependent (S)-NAD(P)H-hydrate dehydratase [Trichophyton mentagrophytes]|uniref:ATP-dependent (S)-NAD(P)H-hydrate dehydratase n=1 Tax=Trichophyton interdigitale (strain MR816) TaxID=1215338 RepID=A0A059IY63_TRIIM|nr:YjeF family domain-containing protein [Trichophyton interdigitale MR816]GBF63120.1 ATP-dependent (S)-NAD(P)H-hydrate dehydratase [Trichophyton mentagrophytes]
MSAATSPNMSSASKTILDKVRKIVPPMLERFHKGQLGRVCVIGGSSDYTGAPYFSAMASAKLGCDMSHVICEPSAAPVIKTYSPNLMVHPILQSSSSVQNDTPNKSVSDHVKPIVDFLPRLHVLVIGPGLGRDPLTQKITAGVIKEAIKQNVALVMDADALILVQNDPKLVHGYKECILTPNVVEFARLSKSVGLEPPSSEGKSDSDKVKSSSEACEKLSRALGGVLIIQKGPHDVISNGDISIISDVEGGKKRSGGQGDTLTGSLGTFMAWRKAYHDGLWDDGPTSSADEGSGNDAQMIKNEIYGDNSDGKKMSRKTTLLLAAWAGSAITRECSRRAFIAKGRSMQAGDLTEEVHESFMELIGERQEDGSKLWMVATSI